MSEESFLTVSEAMEYLGVSRRTIYVYVKQGKLRAYKVPVRGRTVFRVQDLEELKRPRPVDEGKEAA